MACVLTASSEHAPHSRSSSQCLDLQHHEQSCSTDYVSAGESDVGTAPGILAGGLQQQEHQQQQQQQFLGGAVNQQPVKVRNSDTSNHPILVSFPSFNEKAHAAAPAAAAAASQPHDPSTAGLDIHAAGSCWSPAARDDSHSTCWPAASSTTSPDSPGPEGAAGGSGRDAGGLGGSSLSSQHSRKVLGVSLLSQQIACARSLAGTTASLAGAAAAAEAEAAGGASGRHKGEFWRYLQVGVDE